LAVGIVALAVALSITVAGAANQAVTLGSTSGDPTGNICGTSCTYVPFTSLSNPGLQVPFDGSVTSFSVNAGSAGGVVELRVLRPAAAGQYTGAGTSPAETLGTGVNTFTVSLPVKAGDLLGLDNGSSALIFDTSNASPIAGYYQPSLADGKSAAPNEKRDGYRLLLSAIVQPAPTTGTTSTGATGPASTGTTPTTTPPTLTGVAQSNKVWREGNKLALISRKHRPPLGTTISFSLNEQASVSFTFVQQVGGRRVNGKCVAQTNNNRRKRACRRTLIPATASITGHAGTNKIVFQGRVSPTKKLTPGSYTLVIAATNGVGQHSPARQLSFTIVR
jgi:hypothetical protein